jgi:hypothetical protein
MRTAAVRAALLVALLGAPLGALAADEATLLRVFLKDGTSLVSYGEPARVGDRVVFSMPTAATPNPPLHLVNLAADRVDWDRTNRYAASARATHYVQNQAENDYALLSNEIAQALNDVTLTSDPAKRLSIAERARTRLSAWPVDHFNYRATEIRQMLAMLDEAIADLRASTGNQRRFDLSFAAFADPQAIVEPLLPPPTPQEAIENVLTAARVVDNPAERTSLLTTVLVTVDRQKDALPAAWVASTRANVETAIRTELNIDRSYQLLTTRIVRIANSRAKLADVVGLEWLRQYVLKRDQVLGARRPDAVTSLVAVIEEKLDAARRLQLARDRWALRLPVLQEYKAAIREPIDLFGQLVLPLGAIKSLAGSSPLTLATIEHTCERIAKLASAVAPPDELAAAHALLISAVQLGRNAAQIRREAAIAGDMTRAWDASSAAAGSLMLGAKARADIQSLVSRPQLR